MKQQFLVIGMLVVLLASACDKGSETPTPQQSSNEQTTSQNAQTATPPTNPSLTIFPEAPTKQDMIELLANNIALNEGEIQWYVNGMKLDGQNSRQLSYSEVKKGDSVKAVLALKDKETEIESNEVIIANTPPTILSSILEPEIIYRNTPVSVKIEALDADGDDVSIKYQWFLDDALIAESPILDTPLERDKTLKVRAVTFDGEDEGASVTLEAVVANAEPVVKVGKNDFTNNVYQYKLEATDIDNDRVTFFLETAPQGMTIDKDTGLVTWKIDDKLRGTTNQVKVKIDDGHGGVVFHSWAVKIS